MKLTAKLAYSQIKITRVRSVWTLIGIALSTSMFTAVFGFAAAGDAALRELIGANDYYFNMYRTTLLGMSAIFISIIAAASVIVVSNAFRVSAGERITQFGILKSVGATKKQIAETVIYEGVFLCAIGVPAGLVLGLAVNLTGIQIINYFLAGINRLTENPITLRFVLAWQAVALSAAAAFFTVLLSAWLPARKAAKTPAVDAIRGAGEIKVNPKRVRSGWLVNRLFGFEGALASKSLKRSRRNFRATVVSLTVSVTLLVVAGAFGASMAAVTEVFYPGIDATVQGQFYGSSVTYTDDDGNVIRRDYGAIDGALADEITGALRAFPDTAVFGVAMERTPYSAVVPNAMLTPKMAETLESGGFTAEGQGYRLNPVFLITDAENYAGLCERAGVPAGSNILINHAALYVQGGRAVFTPYKFDGLTLRLRDDTGGAELDLPLHGVLDRRDLPGEVLNFCEDALIVLVPDAEVRNYTWFCLPTDKQGFIEYATAVMDGYGREADSDLSNFSVIDAEEVLIAMQSISRLVMTLIYGFVGMLTLIGLTNVISTISANVRTRAREFALLRSAGMTQGGLNRMLSLESVLCSVKSLALGLPLGVVGSYVVYLAMETPAEFPYEIPWLPIVQCALGVFVITWVVMRYSAARLRGGSIVEAIRTEAV